MPRDNMAGRRLWDIRRKLLREMGEVHKLLAEHGKAKVLQLDLDRRVIEAAAGYMGSEEGEVGFLYSGWAQSALPHKRIPDDASWQVHTDHVSLVVQPAYGHP
jgi:hypothetical protein